jgi:hypothetical protein
VGGARNAAASAKGDAEVSAGVQAGASSPR